MNSDTDRAVPSVISDSLQSWNRTVFWLRLLQIILGVSGIACAVAVATFAEDLGSPGFKIASAVAAVCMGIISAFDIGAKANATRRAWRHLRTAVLRYQSVPASTIDHLIDSHSQAEEMIGGLGFKKPANHDS